MSCDRCPLHTTACTVKIPALGDLSTARLILVMEQPTSNADLSGDISKGNIPNFILQVIDTLGIPREAVYLTSLLRCPSKTINGGFKEFSPEDAKKCLEHLYSDLNKACSFQSEPPVIIPMGVTVTEALLKKKSIMKLRGLEENLQLAGGYREYADLKGMTVIPTISPGMVLRGVNPSAVNWFAEDIYTAWCLISGGPTYWSAYEWVDSVERVNELCDQMEREIGTAEFPHLSVDLETTGLDMYGRDKIVTLCLSWKPGMAYSVPFFHKDSPWKNDEETSNLVRDKFCRILSKVPIVGWNFKFDYKWLALHWGLWNLDVVWDGMLAHYWIHGATKAHDLNTVAAEEIGFAGHGRSKDKALAKIKDKDQQNLSNVDIDILLRYGAGDADATLQLAATTRKQIEDIGSLAEFEKLLVQGVVPMAHMEINGILVDPAANQVLEKHYPAQIAKFESSILKTEPGLRAFEAVTKREKKFSLGSSVTLHELLIGQLGFKINKKSKKTGNPSFDASVLEELEESLTEGSLELQVVRDILEWRRNSKYYSTYIRGIPDLIRSDGYFHTNYNLNGTRTGRHSTSAPSLHTIPKTSDVKLQFISRWDGGVILSMDMSQAEVRVVAALSKDAALIDTLRSGVDMHTANASKVFEVPVDQVTKAQRRIAKTITFAILYGASPAKVAATAGITEEEALAAIEAFFKTFPGLRKWMKTTYQTAVKKGYVETPFKRRRYIPGIDRSEWGDKPWRQSINTPIQSTASDITYTALLRALRTLDDLGVRSKPFGFIHDSIIVDVHPGELDLVYSTLEQCMSQWTIEEYKEWLCVPMITDAEICPGWGFSLNVKDRQVSDSGEVSWKLTGSKKAAYMLQKELPFFAKDVKIAELSGEDGEEIEVRFNT